MMINTDTLLFATRLADELGEKALRISRVKLVEVTAANNRQAADFWRDVLRTCESRFAMAETNSFVTTIPGPAGTESAPASNAG